MLLPFNFLITLTRQLLLQKENLVIFKKTLSKPLNCEYNRELKNYFDLTLTQIKLFNWTDQFFVVVVNFYNIPQKNANKIYWL